MNSLYKLTSITIMINKMRLWKYSFMIFVYETENVLLQKSHSKIQVQDYGNETLRIFFYNEIPLL